MPDDRRRTGPLPVNAPVTLIRKRLEFRLAPGDVLAAISHERLPFALAGSWAGGGAIVGSDPLAVAGDGDDPLQVLDELPALATDAGARDHVVGGGWFGWLGYRLAARVERVPPGPPRPVPMPEFHLAYYDNVLRQEPNGDWWFEALASEARRPELDRRQRHLSRLLAHPAGRRRPASAPTVRSPRPLTLSADAATAHLDAIAACRARIAAGEVFQANLCVRLETTTDTPAASLFRRAISTGAAPFAAAFATPRGSIVSLSPELFLRRRADHVMTGPIKGTAPRGAPAADDAARASLLGSAKDAAEHVMIVDLMRNDLGRVSVYGSVQAGATPRAEPHPGLWHLVTTVEGRLRPQTSNAALLRATFPPGSVTGAPKVQALTVIAELERTGREVYTGAIGYVSPLAGLELSVAIRTLELSGDVAWLGAGGGIVADSDPARELEEVLVKARSVATAIGLPVVAE